MHGKARWWIFECQALGVCYGMVWYMAHYMSSGDWVGLVHMAAFSGLVIKVWPDDYSTSGSIFIGF